MAAGKLVAVSIVLLVILGGFLSILFRVSIFQDWEKNRCNPYVVPFSSFFKPATDSRTPSEFAKENWSFCQKEYIQNAIRLAASEVSALVDEQGGVVSIVQGIVSSIADTFAALWKMCYESYSSIMKKMYAAASLFRNMLIQLNSLTDRIQAIVFSITMSLISMLAAFINTVQLVLIVAIIVIGILLILQIILFFLLAPISGLIMTMAAVVSVVVVTVVTAVMASTVAGACFAGETPVHMANGIDIPISEIKVGDVLIDGGVVSAVHEFSQQNILYNLDGVLVTGDHLVLRKTGELIPVYQHERAFPSKRKDKRVWCLTTTTRRIHCLGHVFADWEEIDSDDISLLNTWYEKVWHHLNTHVESPIHFLRPSSAFLRSEAGISPDTTVGRVGWFGFIEWVDASTVEIGDWILSDKQYTPTRVVGIVRLDAKEVVKHLRMVGVNGESQCVSCATWIMNDYTYAWNPAESEEHSLYASPESYIHFYTASGTYAIGHADWVIRDASDVGMENLHPLVEETVLLKEK
jgi:hypothetical protein